MNNHTLIAELNCLIEECEIKCGLLDGSGGEYIGDELKAYLRGVWTVASVLGEIVEGADNE